MFVEPALRGRGLGRELLAALVEHADAAGKSLVSVDCETTNPEAYAFWSARFRPVTWSFERRV
jgi:GNAT superfamily N-acetyltransferase